MRSGRQVPTIYFGTPGSLISLPWPASGIDKPYERQTSDFLTGSGLHQVTTLELGSRQFSIAWDALHVDTFAKLEPYRIGANGPGPFVLIDPSATNLLDANASAAMAVTGHWLQSFISPGGGASGSLVLNVNSSFIHRAGSWASMRWTWSTTPATTPTLVVQSPSRGWASYPCVPTLPYAFSSWVTVDGTVEANATVAVKMKWMDSAGSTLSTSAGTATAITTWTRLSVLASAPAGAAFVQPYWELTGSTMASGGSLYIDEPMLEQDSVLNTWAVGSGIRPVQIVDLTEKVPFDARFRTNITMSLRELAP